MRTLAATAVLTALCMAMITSGGFGEEPADERGQLEQKYLELMKKRAANYSTEQLAAEVKSLENNLAAGQRGEKTNPVIFFEIGCRDAQKTHKFYGDLFRWQIQAAGPVGMISTGTEQGIPGHIMTLGQEPHNYVTVYVQVDDLQKHLDRAGELGGRTIIPPTEVPGMGRFAWFADPEGNALGLWKPLPGGE